ncbi:MAG: HAMP domain-containing histidine kinase [Chitinophagales bacterium]|nr:HAMP domain-containing histidine kinase [Chitinophagales bacterium]
MRNSQISIVVILGVLAILGILTVQIFWLSKAYDVKERQFNESIHTALLNVAEKIASDNEGNLSNEDIVNQLSSDYFVVNINDQIDANTLEYYISNEFEKLQINLDYEYAIYDCASDEMVYGNYVDLDDQITNDKPTKSLPKYNEFSYYFGVFLPTKTSYVLNNLKLTIVFSILLSIALIFFAYAIYIILKQKRLSELQTDFINNMTHEFKTPISAIKLSAEAMLKNENIKTDNRLSNYTKIVQEQAERLNGQVEKVLNIAKLQNDNLELKKEKLNLNEQLEEIVRSASLNFEKNGGSIILNLPENDVEIYADKLHFNNIMYNLLDNALKYNDKTPIVNLSVENRGAKTIIKIKDNGIGIDEKHIKQVFNKFYRVPTGNVHNVKGFGLGLFYVKQVVDKHNWKIKINSKKGEGTTINIEI